MTTDQPRATSEIEGPFTLAELASLPLPAPACSAWTFFHFPTVHRRCARSLLLVTTRASAARLRREATRGWGRRDVRDVCLFLLVRPGSVGWDGSGDEFSQTLLSHYLEQRELQQTIGRLIQQRRIGVLTITADALTPGLLAYWEVKYGGPPEPAPLRLAAGQSSLGTQEERNGCIRF